MSWNYHVPYSDDFADRNPRTKEDVAFDKLDAQGVLHVVQRAMAAENEKVATEQFYKDVETFRHMNPAYLDSDFNKNAMVHHWTHVLGVTVPTLAEIEETYFALRESGSATAQPEGGRQGKPRGDPHKTPHRSRFAPMRQCG